MCSNLLDELHQVRQELRDDKWTEERDATSNIIRIMFQAGGDQLRNIIETLNLLGMIVPAKSDDVKNVAKDIISVQQSKGFLTLVDLRNCLAKVFSEADTTRMDQMVENSQNLFGSGAESVRFEPADLSLLDGTFDMDFTTSLLLEPRSSNQNNQNITNITPLATSSATNSSKDKDDVFAQMEASNPSFAAKLKKFRE